MKWYLITQDDEPWKLPLAMRHLAGHGIKPKVVHGFNGALLGLRPVNPHNVRENGSYDYMHPSAVGCVLSHLAALMIAVTENASEFIVAEDDILLPDDFQSRWDSVKDEIPDDLEIMQLEHLHTDLYHREQISTNLARCFYPMGAACIWWTASAARRAIRMLRPIESPYDIMLVRKVFPFLSHAIVYPALASQRTAFGQWPSSVGTKPKD